MCERTFVGLDVHARSVVACGIDTVTGEVVQGRLTTDFEELWNWRQALEGPVSVAYEAGPRGFVLARALAQR
jgi:transposase